MNSTRQNKKGSVKAAVVRHHPVRHMAGRESGRVPAWVDAWRDPFAVSREMDTMFDMMPAVPAILPSLPWREPVFRFVPEMDMTETPQEIRITAELPGVDKKDLHVTLEGETLRLRGEKRTTHEERSRQSYRLERSYGSFERVVPLPAPVDGRKADAHIRKGILSIVLPKSGSAPRHEHKIEVKAA